MSKKLALPLLLLSVTLAGCSGLGSETEPPRLTGTLEQVCNTDGGWKPIFTSKDDKFTEPTATMIAKNNEGNRTWCKSEPPAKAVAKKPDAKTS